MSLAPSQGYYVTDRIDLVPPPPPRPQSQIMHRGPYPMPGHGHHAGPPSAQPGPPTNSYSHSQSAAPSGNSYNTIPANPNSQQYGNSYQPSSPQSHGPPSSANHGPSSVGSNHGPPLGGSNHGPPPGSQGPQGAMSYDEWQATPPPPPPPGAGKIINRPPNPYKDQFKPSYVSSQLSSVSCRGKGVFERVNLLELSIISGYSRPRRTSRSLCRAQTASIPRRPRLLRSKSPRQICTCCELSRSSSTEWT